MNLMFPFLCCCCPVHVWPEQARRQDIPVMMSMMRFSMSDNITRSTALVTALENVTTLSPTTTQAINDTNITVPHKCLLLLYEDIGKSRWERQNEITVWLWDSCFFSVWVSRGWAWTWPSRCCRTGQNCFIYFLQSPLLGSFAPGSQCAFLYVSSLEAALCQGQNPGHFQPNLHYILHTSEYCCVLLNWLMECFFCYHSWKVPLNQWREREPRPNLTFEGYIYYYIYYQE